MFVVIHYIFSTQWRLKLHAIENKGQLHGRFVRPLFT